MRREGPRLITTGVRYLCPYWETSSTSLRISGKTCQHYLQCTFYVISGSIYFTLRDACIRQEAGKTDRQTHVLSHYRPMLADSKCECVSESEWVSTVDCRTSLLLMSCQRHGSFPPVLLTHSCNFQGPCMHQTSIRGYPYSRRVLKLKKHIVRFRNVLATYVPLSGHV